MKKSVYAAAGIKGCVFISGLLIAGTQYLTEAFLLFMVSEVSAHCGGEVEAEQRSTCHTIQDTDKEVQDKTKL